MSTKFQKQNGFRRTSRLIYSLNRDAVEIVKSVIDRNKQRDIYGEKYLFLFCPGIGHELLRAIAYVDTKGFDLMPEPPGFRHHCCASKSDLKTWLGAILQFLYEQKLYQKWYKAILKLFDLKISHAAKRAFIVSLQKSSMEKILKDLS